MTKWLVRQSSTTEVRFRFPGGQIAHKLSNSDLVNFLLKSNDGRDRRSSFAIFVVWSADYASAKTLERISLSCFHEQQADHYSHVFSLRVPLQGNGTWVESNISSCCKWRKMESRRSPKFSTTMFESFSADLLSAKKVFG